MSATDSLSPAEITLTDIEAAARRIAGSVAATRCGISRTLSELTGAEVVLKHENLQFTGAYKERGALNRLLLLSPAERARGVVAMSAGNHAQAVAYHAARLGIVATIVMPESTPFTKVSSTEVLGAEVVLHGANLAEAAQEADKLCQARGAIFVHPYNDAAVVAGQGTVALEMQREFPKLDALLIPVGGGGLLTGVGIASKAVSPTTEIVAVQAERHPYLLAPLGFAPEPAATLPIETLAEGIAVKKPGAIALQYAHRLVDAGLTVSEAKIEEAINLFLEFEKTVVEGAGAIGLSALLEQKERFAGKQVGVIITGGNIDQRVLADTILRGLVRSGRLSRLWIRARDLPGALASITRLIAQERANIVEVNHQRAFSASSITTARVEIVLATRDREHTKRVISALEDDGHEVEHVH